MKERSRKIKTFIKEYHAKFLCIVITISLLALGIFRFPNAIGRIVEAFRDLGISCAYYVCELFDIKHSLTPTVNTLPDYSFLNIGNWLPFVKKVVPYTTFPETFEEFKLNWSVYWDLFMQEENVNAYLSTVGDILYYVSKFLLLLLPVLVVSLVLLRRNFEKENNDYNVDSKPLQSCISQGVA